MKQLQFLIKPAAGYCNMRCQYCFYRDEQQNRVNPEDCMMTRATAETLIQRCFVEIEQGGFVSFAFQGGEPTLAGLDFSASLRRRCESTTRSASPYSTPSRQTALPLPRNGLNFSAKTIFSWASAWMAPRMSMMPCARTHRGTGHGIKSRRRSNCCAAAAWSATFVCRHQAAGQKGGARV